MQLLPDTGFKRNECHKANTPHFYDERPRVQLISGARFERTGRSRAYAAGDRRTDIGSVSHEMVGESRRIDGAIRTRLSRRQTDTESADPGE